MDSTAAGSPDTSTADTPVHCNAAAVPSRMTNGVDAAPNGAAGSSAAGRSCAKMTRSSHRYGSPPGPASRTTLC
jgi:hypothetical protein